MSGAHRGNQATPAVFLGDFPSRFRVVRNRRYCRLSTDVGDEVSIGISDASPPIAKKILMLKIPTPMRGRKDMVFPNMASPYPLLEMWMVKSDRHQGMGDGP